MRLLPAISENKVKFLKVGCGDIENDSATYSFA